MRRIALVALLAFATAVPAQQQHDKKSAAGGRTANLPDFTSLMKQQGPAVVNVITKRDPARTARNERGQPGPQGQGPQGPQSQGEDPLLEFFRRFMPDAPRARPDAGTGPGPGLGLHHQPGWLRAHQRPRGRRRRRSHRSPRRRQARIQGQGDRRRRAHRHRAAQDRRHRAADGQARQIRARCSPANGSRRSARHSASRTPSPPGSSAPPGARCRTRPTCPSSRPTSR